MNELYDFLVGMLIAALCIRLICVWEFLKYIKSLIDYQTQPDTPERKEYIKKFLYKHSIWKYIFSFQPLDEEYWFTKDESDVLHGRQNGYRWM